jgi:hypothetical protein
MPLEPIDHRAAKRPSARRPPLSRIALFLSGLTLLAAITGCAEGTARDARQGQEADAERTSVVRDLQATRSARILASTPTPP